MSIYVVTGGAGFIGSHLAAHIGRAGHEVRALDNLTGAASRDRAATLSDAPHVTLLEGDVRDPDVCRRALAGADYVLHHAGISSVPRSIDDPAECVAVNIGGTLNLLEAARQSGTMKRFIFASSCAVYGDTPGVSKHEASQADPISPYASSKIAGEYLCRNYFRLHGLPTVCLRYFNVYGPDVYGSVQNPQADEGFVIPKFLRALIRGEKPVVYGDGDQSRDFIHVEDIVEANLRAAAATRGVAGKSFNIGTGQSVSLKQLLEKLEILTKQSLEFDRQPARPGDIKHSRADIAAAAGLLQFTPSVPLSNGLARTLHWYTENSKP